MYYFYYGSYGLVIIGAIISMIASWNVKSTFNRYKKVNSTNRITSQEAAERILHNAGIYDVRIERIRGDLTDHYSPSEKVLRLSDTVYNSTSVAAIGVAAHECGHAIQHNVEYGPLGLRSASVPIANIGSKLSWPVIILGLILGNTAIAEVGILLFVFVVFFQLITLPVEFDASHRALQILERDSMLVGQENAGARKVLTAAALTYVAALFTTILQLIRLIMIVSNASGRRRD